MENMDIWNKVRRPPETALKQITAGRLKGKSDISPQWRYQVLTEVLGPCGIGWKYEIKKLWTEAGSYDQVMAFSEVLLWVKVDGQWSEPIPGIGGAALIAKESSGLHSNDEGYKMAVTDALSVALKMIGVAADIYAGLWDGSKYKEDKNEEKKKLPEMSDEDFKINSDQWKKLITGEPGKTAKDMVRYLSQHKTLTQKQENEILSWDKKTKEALT